MRVDKIRFGKIKSQWNILQMKAAYIAAERELMGNPELTGWDKEAEPDILLDAETSGRIKAGLFTSDPNLIKNEEILGNYYGMSKRDELMYKIAELEETGRRLIEQEKYELAQEAYEIWQKLNDELNRL